MFASIHSPLQNKLDTQIEKLYTGSLSWREHNKQSHGDNILDKKKEKKR